VVEEKMDQVLMVEEKAQEIERVIVKGLKILVVEEQTAQK